MTFATVGTLRTLPERRDELIALLTRRIDGLSELGCVLYEVGHCETDPNTVAILEIWESEEAHDAALLLPDSRSVIEEARALLTGDIDGFTFTVAGSPLRQRTA